MPATSSTPSAAPWALPEFCLVGAGQPMIVLSTMIDGLAGLGLGRLDRGQQGVDVLDVTVRRAPVDRLDVPAVGLVALRTSSLNEMSVSSSIEMWFWS